MTLVKFSEDHKRKLKENHVGMTGKVAWNKGLTKETDNRITYGRYGEENGNWNGGCSDYWARMLRKQYKECCLCKSTYKLEMHHKNHNRKDNERLNLIILCLHCHSFWHNN